MRDYSKNKNYKLHCKKTGKDYYGHTTLTLKRRLSLHVKVAKKQECTSYHIIDGGDYEIVLLEDYPCKNKKEAHARERWWIENHPCVNKVIPGRTKSEYYHENKQQIAVKTKKYHQQNYAKNKTEINARNNEWYHNNKEESLKYAKARYDWISSWGGSSPKWKGLNQIAIDLFD